MNTPKGLPLSMSRIATMRTWIESGAVLTKPELSMLLRQSEAAIRNSTCVEKYLRQFRHSFNRISSVSDSCAVCSLSINDEIHTKIHPTT